ncbi:MAG: metallophosphoesterase [Sphingomonadaceae bacterium]|nr:metallophosphoesterase [Sphingomonadaceae bacterium]
MRLLAAILTLCAALVAVPAAAAARAYVLIGDGGPVARVVTAAATCPVLRVDGRDVAMAVRFAAATVPQRPTASTPERSKPSAFPVTVCEARLPLETRRASVGGVALPLPKRVVRRIVVIGDTGCRIKAADNAAQACNDPVAFPFARIAARAAAEKPDLVVHVGDYLYRENPCPGDGHGNAHRDARGCAGSPWGYGWDAWDADFFTPAAPLLAAAPWAAVRGNHESCARAGQGWWRFLDGHVAVAATQTCDNPLEDQANDWSAPFAVGLGKGAQLVVLDLSIAPNKPLAADDWRAAAFEASYQALAGFAAQARFTIAADHQPILGFSANIGNGTTNLVGGNVGIQSVWGRHGVRQLPPGVSLLLSGHYHLWQQVGFAGDVPSQFITGFSGTLEDVVPLPDPLPTPASPAPGVTATSFASWVDGFGYMVLDRVSTSHWRATVHAADGRIVDRCRIDGTASRCTVARVPAEPTHP